MPRKRKGFEEPPRRTIGHLVERFAHHPEGTNVAIPTTVQHLEILVPLGGKNPERDGERMEVPR